MQHEDSSHEGMGIGWENIARIGVLGGGVRGSVFDAILCVLHRAHGSESGKHRRMK